VQVSGQVFEVDDAMLQSMDTFEEVGALSGYVRLALELESAQLDAGVLRADAYMKEQHQLVECLLIEGPFADYTAELAVGYRLELP
jgi:gamma-glutamylaminecyclotransferase